MQKIQVITFEKRENPKRKRTNRRKKALKETILEWLVIALIVCSPLLMVIYWLIFGYC